MQSSEAQWVDSRAQLASQGIQGPLRRDASANLAHGGRASAPIWLIMPSRNMAIAATPLEPHCRAPKGWPEVGREACAQASKMRASGAKRSEASRFQGRGGRLRRCLRHRTGPSATTCNNIKQINDTSPLPRQETHESTPSSSTTCGAPAVRMLIIIKKISKMAAPSGTCRTSARVDQERREGYKGRSECDRPSTPN